MIDLNEAETSELIEIVSKYVEYADCNYLSRPDQGGLAWYKLKKRLGNMGRYKVRIDKALEILDDQTATRFMENGDTWNNIDIEKVGAILEGDYDEQDDV